MLEWALEFSYYHHLFPMLQLRSIVRIMKEDRVAFRVLPTTGLPQDRLAKEPNIRLI